MQGSRAIRALGWVALAGSAACSPSLDWREFAPEGVGLQVGFPCRPERSGRPVVVAGRTAPLTLTMLACEADGQTFALAFADAADPSDRAEVLRALRRAALCNIGADDASPTPQRVAGTPAGPETGVVVADGRLPDGRRVREHLALFAKELRVYQAAVIGAAPGAEAVATFFGALRAAP